MNFVSHSDRGSVLGRAASFLAMACLVACGKQASEAPPSVLPAQYVDADGSHPAAELDTLRNRYPHIQYQDGVVSLNDRCPVRKASLNLRLPPLFVNGKPIGFC